MKVHVAPGSQSPQLLRDAERARRDRVKCTWEVTRTGRPWRNQNPCPLLVGLLNGAATMENNLRVPPKKLNIDSPLTQPFCPQIQTPKT